MRRKIEWGMNVESLEWGHRGKCGIEQFNGTLKWISIAAE
jgi:hypothetical protein